MRKHSILLIAAAGLALLVAVIAIRTAPVESRSPADLSKVVADAERNATRSFNEIHQDALRRSCKGRRR